MAGATVLVSLMSLSVPGAILAGPGSKCQVGTSWSTGRCGETCFCEENQVLHCAMRPCVMVERDRRGRVLVTETSQSERARWRRVLFDSHKAGFVHAVRMEQSTAAPDGSAFPPPKEEEDEDPPPPAPIEYADYEDDAAGLKERLRRRRKELHARAGTRRKSALG